MSNIKSPFFFTIKQLPYDITLFIVSPLFLYSYIDDGEYVKGIIYKNGSRQSISEAVNYSSASDQQVDSNGSYLMDLAAADYIEIYFQHTEGGATTVFGGTSDGSWFFGQKLGGV